MNTSIEERLHDLWHASRAAWPGVDLAAAEFSSHVLARIDPEDDRGLDELNANDLYLACACLRSVTGAHEAFDHTLLVHVPRFLARIDPSAALADEVRQILRERLFVAGDDEPPRIAAYHGRGSLLAWLRIAAVRAALDLKRSRSREVPLDEARIAELAGGDPELELIKDRYRDEFRSAVTSALQGLPRRERNLMRLHLVGGVSTAKLGAMFHVDQSTVVRWLAAARTQIREAVFAHLRDRLDATTAEMLSVIRLLLTTVDLSLSQCLRATDP